MNHKIQKKLEYLAPELDEYLKRRIFNDKEIDRIVENRRIFETNLIRSKKKLDDFIEYIESEELLEKIRNKRMKKNKIPLLETDILLEKNLISIYQRAIYYFNDLKLIEKFSKFCILRQYHEEMKEVFAKKCLKNLSNTDLWIFCINKLWEIEDIESVRNMCFKAIKVNNNPRILLEFFKIECNYADKLNKLNDQLEIEENDKDPIEKGEVAIAIFKEILKNKEINYFNECLEISQIVPGLKDKIKELIHQVS